MGYTFTSESVSEGHPDKVADQISDAILDAYLAEDPNSRVAVETLVTTNRVILAGEIKVSEAAAKAICKQDREEVARRVIRDIGYTHPEIKFAWDSAKVTDLIHSQSDDISKGVDHRVDGEQGAGDQGMMFGYACKEIDGSPHADSRVLMPMPLYYAHQLVKTLAAMRKERPGCMPYLRPDSKSQVTVRYSDRHEPIAIDTVVVSTQHAAGVSKDKIKADILEVLIPEVFRDRRFRPTAGQVAVNPAGKFVTGGPDGDTGLTGRKIIVDTYGGRGAHGGGAFSGKDPSKVDRSAAYALRHAAKNMVAAGLADTLEIQVAYAIGKPDPVSVFVDSSHTVQEGLTDQDLREIVQGVFDLKPRAITARLKLTQPIYQKTAAYGHFGQDGFPWEALDCVSKVLESADRLRHGGAR